MEFHWFKKACVLLLIIPASYLACSFHGCSPDSSKDIQPFVRLLDDLILESKVLNYPIRYAVLLPQDYDKTKESYPVVYLLHGWGDNHTAWYKGGSIQYFADRFLSETGPMIFVMPQGFNTYYVNKFNGTFPYMDMFTRELVPAIDSVFRTKKDKSQRAVMGYSMGGYGALILPALNPNIFSISVPLSMSFRTDQQYIDQSQSSWDNQFGTVFGGIGNVGNLRLTPHFIAHSPFHLFAQPNLSAYKGLKILLDCGDDEESLHITNGVLHNLMLERNIQHEFRTRNGGHSWTYWHASLPEALNFISNAFKSIPYPPNPPDINVGNIINNSQYQLQGIPDSEILLGVYKPTNYNSTADSLPVIFILHHYQGSQRQASATQILSFLNNKMQSGIIPHALVVEIPVAFESITASVFSTILREIKNRYRVTNDKRRRILIGNESGGNTAMSLLPTFKESLNACFLYNANLSGSFPITQDVFYYIDVTDKAEVSQDNFNLFITLLTNKILHEYRVRQGTQSLQSFLNGLDNSLSVISNRLKI